MLKAVFLKAEQTALFLENPEFVELKKEVKEIKGLLQLKNKHLLFNFFNNINH